MPSQSKKPNNLLTEVPANLPDELVETLVHTAAVRIERIVSTGHASADGFWYDQPRAEWVVVLSGAARLRIEGQQQPVEMKPGDWIKLPAHTRHRVQWTTPKRPTVWLAVHYTDD